MCRLCRLLSSMHLSTQGERRSIPYFINPKLNYVIQGPKKKFSPVTGFDLLSKTGYAPHHGRPAVTLSLAAMPTLPGKTTRKRYDGRTRMSVFHECLCRSGKPRPTPTHTRWRASLTVLLSLHKTAHSQH